MPAAEDLAEQHDAVESRLASSRSKASTVRRRNVSRFQDAPEQQQQHDASQPESSAIIQTLGRRAELELPFPASVEQLRHRLWTDDELLKVKEHHREARTTPKRMKDTETGLKFKKTIDVVADESINGNETLGNEWSRSD